MSIVRSRELNSHVPRDGAGFDICISDGDRGLKAQSL
jgi:hypothetical protein